MPSAAATHFMSGEPNAVRTFLRRFAIPIADLAELLNLEPEALRRYAESGGAPPWVAYALLGVGYHRFGVEPESDSEHDRPVLPPTTRLPRRADGSGSLDADTGR